MSDKIKTVLRLAGFAYIVAFQYGFIKGYSEYNKDLALAERRVARDVRIRQPRSN